MKKLLFFLHGVSERHAEYGDPLPALVQKALTKKQKPFPYIRKSFWGNFLGENEKLWTAIEQEFAETEYRDPNFDQSKSFKYKSLRKGFFAKFVGDTFSYLSANTGSKIRHLIAMQLKESLSLYHDATEIYFIAHSLGTAILWDILFSNRFPPDDGALTIRNLLNTKISLKGIITMGSPIPFVNMTLGTTPQDVEQNFKNYLKKSQESIRWFNFIHASDVIAYPLHPLLKTVNPQLLKMEDIYLSHDISAIETTSIDLVESKSAQFLLKIKPNLQEAISCLPALVGTPRGHTCYWEQLMIAQYIAKILYPQEFLDFAEAMNDPPSLNQIISRIQNIPGMTKVQVELPGLNDEVVIQFLMNDHSGSVLVTKNLVGIYHVKIMNHNGATVYFGYVGWVHVEGLLKEVAAIEAEFG
jgi:hypothetical protein